MVQNDLARHTSQQHQVEIHHTGVQFCNRFDFAELAFLLFRREHELETIALVEKQRDRLVVRIDN